MKAVSHLILFFFFKGILLKCRLEATKLCLLQKILNLSVKSWSSNLSAPEDKQGNIKTWTAKEASVQALRVQQAHWILQFLFFPSKVLILYTFYLRNILTEIVIRRHLIKTWRIQIHKWAECNESTGLIVMQMLECDGNNKMPGIKQDQSCVHERDLNKKTLGNLLFSFLKWSYCWRKNVLMQYWWAYSLNLTLLTMTSFNVSGKDDALFSFSCLKRHQIGIVLIPLCHAN